MHDPSMKSDLGKEKAESYQVNPQKLELET